MPVVKAGEILDVLVERGKIFWVKGCSSEGLPAQELMKFIGVADLN